MQTNDPLYVRKVKDLSEAGVVAGPYYDRTEAEAHLAMLLEAQEEEIPLTLTCWRSASAAKLR
jgi:hypothetical protein